MTTDRMTQPPNPSRPAMTEAEREAMVAMADACEKATGPDREVDAAIADTLMLPLDWGMSAARYTGSIDAAMTLMPINVDFTLERDGAWLRWIDNALPTGIGEAQSVLIGKGGSCTALALTAAALRARANQGTPA